MTQKQLIIIGNAGIIFALISMVYMVLLLLGLINPSSNFNYLMMVMIFISLPMIKFAEIGFEKRIKQRKFKDG